MRTVLPLMVVLLAGCGWLRDQVKDPEVAYEAARVTSVDFEQIAIELELAVTNPNPVGVTLSGYDLDLNIGELPCVRAKERQDIDLRGGKAATVLVPISLKWTEVQAAAGDLMKDGEVPKDVPWTANGTVTVVAGPTELEVPFSAAGDLPVVVPPTLVPTDLRFVRADLAKAQLEVDVQIENPNARPIAADRVEWLVEVEGREASRGRLEKPVRIKARGKAEVTLHVEASSRDLGLAAFAMLARSGELDVRVRGSAMVDTGLGKNAWSFDSREDVRTEGRKRR